MHGRSGCSRREHRAGTSLNSMTCCESTCSRTTTPGGTTLTDGKGMTFRLRPPPPTPPPLGSPRNPPALPVHRQTHVFSLVAVGSALNHLVQNLCMQSMFVWPRVNERTVEHLSATFVDTHQTRLLLLVFCITLTRPLMTLCKAVQGLLCPDLRSSCTWGKALIHGDIQGVQAKGAVSFQ